MPNDISKLQEIIINSDSEILIEESQRIGSSLARNLSASQIRGIFGTVRRIEMDLLMLSSSDGHQSTKDINRVRLAKRSFALLRPRLEYQAAREGRGVRELKQELVPAMELVSKEKDDNKFQERFRNFVDFFEAILAYHRANGGSNK